jgi:transposase
MTTITNNTGTLYIALELGCDKWVLASATQAAEKPRFRTVPARSLAMLQEEVAKAKVRFGLHADAPVCTCYEAGRDGFWLHRALTKLGITNVVVDASSIEVNRRQKHVKSDPDRRQTLPSLRFHRRVRSGRVLWRPSAVPPNRPRRDSNPCRSDPAARC